MATSLNWEDSSVEQEHRMIEEQMRQIDMELNLIQESQKSALTSQKILATEKKSEPTTSNPQTTSGNLFDKYEKRAESLNFGSDFEYLMCAFYALNMCVNDDIHDFVISTNKKNGGAFDDILLDVTFKNNSSKTFAIQLKHKDNKSNITDTNFATTSKKNDFALLKYLRSFENMDKVDNVICVLYTNASTKITNHHKFKISTKTPENQFDVHVLENNDRDLINLLSNKQSVSQNIFQFKITQTPNKPKQFQRIEQFSEQFYFFPDQLSSAAIKWTIDRLLKNMCLCDVFDSFAYFMKTWWSGEFVLRKDDVIAKLTELSLSPWTKTLSAKKENRKTSLLKEAIMSFDVTLMKHNKKNIVENIWNVAETQDALIGKAIKKFGLGVGKTSNKQKCIALWYLNKVPLIVDVTDTNEAIVIKALNLLKKSLQPRKIVLVGKVNEEDLLNIDIFENLLNLFNNNTLQNHFQFIMDNFHVRIQEKQKISLRRLSRENLNMIAYIKTNQLLEMTQDDLVFGSQEGTLPEYYLSRIPTGIFLQTEKIIKRQCYGSTNDSVVIFNCNDDTVKYLGNKTTLVEMSEYLSGDVKLTPHCILISIRETCSVFNFQKVCDTVPNSDVYLLQIIDKTCSRLLFKNGNKLPLKELKCLYKPIQESEILEYFDNSLNVICAPPGMGKSSLFIHLSQTSPIDICTIRVNLINYNLFFKNSLLNYEKILFKFLNMDDNTDAFPGNIKSGLLESGKMLIFLDGLDEIDSRFVNVVLEFAKYASSNGIRIWISTRENLRSLITKTINIVPIEIPELNPSQQKFYVENRLRDKYESEEIDKIVKAIFTNSDVINSRQLLGVPLQLYIITENFLNHNNIYESLNKHSVFVLTGMYRLFFEGKKQFYEKKFGVDLNQIGIFFTCFLRLYELPALSSCLDYYDFEDLIIDHRNYNEFLKEIKIKGDKFGIIQSVNEEFMAIFVHQTFAEYFACLWFKNNPDKLLRLRDKMFSVKYQNLKLMLDILLAENNPLHLAVIYQNVEQFQKNINQIDVRDSGGRTALHLACSYGNKYLQQKDYYFDFCSSRPVRDSPNLMAILKILFVASANIFTSDKLFQFDCIQYASKSQCMYTFELILKNHLLDLKSLHRFLPLNSAQCLAYYASRLGYVNLLRALIAHKYCINDQFLLIGAIEGCENDDYSSVRYGNLQVVQELLNHRVNNSKKYKMECFDDDIIIRTACKCGNINIIKLLMCYGLKCKKNNTVLHYISEMKSEICHQTCINLLKLNSVNVNSQNDSGETALHIACACGSINNVKVLLEFGADITIADKYGKSVMDYARNYYDSTISDLLLKYDCKKSLLPGLL